MYGVAGTTGIYTGNPLERQFRDIEVLKHHGFASEGRYETVGQVYLGLSPDLQELFAMPQHEYHALVDTG